MNSNALQKKSLFYSDRTDRAILFSCFTAAGILASLRVDYLGFPGYFAQMENSRAYLFTGSAAYTGFLVYDNIHGISSIIAAVRRGNIISWWPVNAKFLPDFSVGLDNTFSFGL
jgi:hypothetical protein